MFWSLFLLLTGGVMLGSHHQDVSKLTNVIAHDQEHELDKGARSLTSGLDSLINDVLYLARQTALLEWSGLAVNGSLPPQEIVADYRTFLETHPGHDQLRIISRSGVEKIRLHRDKKGIAVVNPSALQDKSSRYYFLETMKLGNGEVYVSPLDLNIEKGVVEQPLKPTIRVATPLFDAGGEKLGMLIINHNARRLLEQLQRVNDVTPEGQLWLLNRAGYWLYAPDSSMQWGFMLPENDQQNMPARYPAIWSEIAGLQGGMHYRGASGIWTATAVDQPLASGRQPGRWLLVAYHSPPEFDKLMQPQQDKSLAIFLMVALATGLLVAFAVYWYSRHEATMTLARENEKRFQDLLQSAPDAIVVTNEQGSIVLVNRQAEKLFGYAQEAMRGQPVEMLMPERFRTGHVQHRAGYRQDPTARLMMTGRELVALSRDGREIPVEISLSPLKTADGKLMVTNIVRDVSERKKALQARDEMQRRFWEIANNLPVGIFRKDTEGDARFMEINQAMADMFEADSTEELLKHSVSDIHKLVENVDLIRDMIFADGSINNQEFIMKTLKGREFHASITAVLRTDENLVPFIDGIVEDITDRKQQEHEIRALNRRLKQHADDLEVINSELEAFSYSVSHDLRAPLRAIDGFSQTLARDYADKLDERGLDRLSRVRRAAQRMGQLIDDLLQLSRVSRTDLSRQDTDLTKICHIVMDGLKAQYPNLTAEFAVQPGMHVFADAGLMRIVMENLIGNAVKFSARKDKARIEIGSEPAGKEMRIHVRDNGAGFDMRYAGKLFGAFQRLHNEADFQGTGIGLATVQRIVHKHGGRVEAEGVVGQGAAFYFYL